MNTKKTMTSEDKTTPASPVLSKLARTASDAPISKAMDGLKETSTMPRKSTDIATNLPKRKNLSKMASGAKKKSM